MKKWIINWITKEGVKWFKTEGLKLIISNLMAFLYTQKWFHNFMMIIVPKLRLSTYYAQPSNKNYTRWGALARKGYEYLKPGHIVLTLDEKKLSNVIIGKATAKYANGEVDFIPSHAALCVAKDRKENFEIAEMTHEDFTRSTWEDLCYEATRVVILECTDFDEKYIKEKLIPTCLSFKDKKYDIVFDQGKKDLICSELVYFSDVEKRLDVKLDPILGFKPYISPVGLYKGKNVKVIWDSEKES